MTDWTPAELLLILSLFAIAICAAAAVLERGQR